MALLPVADARQQILDGISPLPLEMVRLVDAHMRIAAAPLRANRTQPPFDASAMDGYAVRHADLTSDGQTLRVVSEIAAGSSYSEKLGTGEATRIFTGAPLPDGADTILIQEDAHEFEPGFIQPTEIPRPGAFVRKAGLDFSQGDELISRFTKLNAVDIALLASMNHPDVPVIRKPRIGVLATGDELVMPGETIGKDQIVASNNFGIAARIAELGGLPIRLGIASDSKHSLSNALFQAQEEQCDAIVTLGGASVGTHDLVQETFKDAGLDLAFWKIAMRPGKPLMFGKIDGMVFLGFPGNPVSSMVCAELFLGPLVNAWLGQPTEIKFVKAQVTHKLCANDQREDYLRAHITLDRNSMQLPKVSAMNRQDSSMLALFRNANALLMRQPFASEAPVGSLVDVLVLRD
ncbi:MAG: gephyrin-like molybdotransferase Glp [Hyphomicrobiales bacterium]